MDESQNNEVKQGIEEVSSIVANVENNEVPVAENSQPKEENQIDPSKVALLELEETLKTLQPEEVLKYQRELSVEMKENLFEGEIGELFKKYKPDIKARQEKVKSVAEVMKGTRKTEPQPQTTDTDLKQELLKSKIELELVKRGTNQEFLEEATIIALSKIKDLSEIGKCQEIASKFSSLDNRQTPPQRTTITIGEGVKELSDGEKAIEFLKKLNPKGFK